MKEGAVIDLETVSDSEFRQFVLWRMGIATKDDPPPVLESVSPKVPRKLRPFDERRVRR